MQSPGFTDAARRIVRQQRRHLHRYPTVDAAGRLVGRSEQIRRLREVFEREFDEQVLARKARGRLAANRIVIEAAATDGAIENRRVGREPRDVEIIDVAAQGAVDQHLARNVVEPEALPKVVKSSRRFHRCSCSVNSAWRWPGNAVNSSSVRSPMWSTDKSAGG